MLRTLVGLSENMTIDLARLTTLTIAANLEARVTEVPIYDFLSCNGRPYAGVPDLFLSCPIVRLLCPFLVFGDGWR